MAHIAPCARSKNPARYGLVHEVPFEFRFVGINAVQWASGRARAACLLRVFVDGQETYQSLYSICKAVKPYGSVRILIFIHIRSGRRPIENCELISILFSL